MKRDQVTPWRMPHVMRVVGASAVLAALTAGSANAQHWRPGGQVWVPDSSVEQPDQIGVTAHTNIKIFTPSEGPAAALSPSAGASPQQGPPFAGYFFETPASLACVYNLVPLPQAGCNPNNVAANPAGGARAVAIVDAYHYPTAVADLQQFSTQFGLPQPSSANFQLVYAQGRQPMVNADWNIEEALDVEWAHAMAPQAKIYLVEAASSNFSSLLQAVSVANTLVAQAGGGEVSMSWGGSEFNGETSYDGYFTQSGVVYFAAAGDSPGVNWPSASPNVVSVGGISLSRNPATGTFQEQLAWQSGGGGPSQYEAIPSFQSAVAAIVQNQRGTPDVAADADPATGVWVYENGGWYIVGGTSVATPVWAGIVNTAGKFATGAQELVGLYAAYANSSTYASDFDDIVQGSCGPNEGYLAATGWDFCTGIGSPQGYGGK
jgi:kumamolisin